MLLPANTINLYDEDGTLMGRLLYKDNEVAHQPCGPISQELDNQCHDGISPSSCSTEDGISSGSEVIHPISTQTLSNSCSDATHSSLTLLPSTTKDRSLCKDSCTTSAASVVIDRDAYPPTHLQLTTFDEPERLSSNLKTTLAASISRLVKDDDTLLHEFDELRSTLKEAKKNKSIQINLKEKVERYKVLSAKITLQVQRISVAFEFPVILRNPRARNALTVYKRRYTVHRCMQHI